MKQNTISCLLVSLVFLLSFIFIHTLAAHAMGTSPKKEIKVSEEKQQDSTSAISSDEASEESNPESDSSPDSPEESWDEDSESNPSDYDSDDSDSSESYE
jgi:hypothetical protein